MDYKSVIKNVLLLTLILQSTICFANEESTPQETFNNYCFSCHGTGWEDAPVVGDSYAWEERKAQGIEVLVKHTLEGYNSMPAKGGCASCTPDELKAVIEWMME